jgi:hypothetical protein
MSYKCEIKVLHDQKYYQNAVSFATEEEAKAYGRNKLCFWTVSEDFRVVESTESVNYRWDHLEGLVAIEKICPENGQGA